MGVALTSVPNVGASVFEHRNEEWRYITLSVHIFHGLEHTGALPFPTVEAVFKIPAMALPSSDNIAVQTFLKTAVSILVDDKWSVLAHILLVEVNEILLHFVTSYQQGNFRFLVIFTESSLHIALESGDRFGSEWNVAEVLTYVHHHGITLQFQ